MAQNMLRLLLGVTAETGLELTETLSQALTKANNPEVDAGFRHSMSSKILIFN
jgi:hypothetical protein